MITSNADRRAIAVVGPIPPPLHGFSHITQEMASALHSAGPIVLFNTAPSGLKQTLRNAIQFRSVLRHRHATTIYIALSGGKRQLIDLYYITIAAKHGCPIYLHHHSFAYLNSPTWLSKRVIQSALGAVHITLCACMGERLVNLYRVEPEKVRVLSNSVFVHECPDGSRQGTLTIGYISNITAEKGIFDFLKVVRECRAAGVHIQAKVAGPVSRDIKRRFENSLAELSEVEYLGPVVGDEKIRFFQSIQVLLFPTRYRNEAEPVVILEALAAGVPVVANDRGCISEIVSDRSGYVVANSDSFVDVATYQIKRFSQSTEALNIARRNARDHFLELKRGYTQRLNALKAEMRDSDGS